MAEDLVNLKVPRAIAEELDKRAKRKDRLKQWTTEAREILQSAVKESDAVEASTE